MRTQPSFPVETYTPDERRVLRPYFTDLDGPVFALVNLSLIRLHRRGPAPAEVFQVPHWVPVAGALASIAVLGGRIVSFWF